MFSRGIDRPTFIAFLVLAFLLAVTGVTVFQNIDRLSESVYENQKRFLTSAMLSFRRDFTGALIDLGRGIEPSRMIETEEDLKSELIDLFQDTEQNIVSQLSLYTLTSERPGSYSVLDDQTGLFVDQEPPPSLHLAPNQVRAFLLSRLNERPGVRLQVEESRLQLAIPFLLNRRGVGRRGPFPPPPPPPSRPPRGEAGMARTQRSSGGANRVRAALIMLELSPEYLDKQFFQSLKKNYFNSPFLVDFKLAVVGNSIDSLLYKSDAELDPSFFLDAEVSLPLAGPAGWLAPRNFGPNGELLPEFEISSPRKLALLARHQLGSLKTAVDRQRTFDLIKAFGILSLLGMAATTFLLSVQKTRKLAKRQMDFVAGISHELRNPLTALQSAGFNLSGGRIKTSEKIQEYGDMILRESRRLIQMVEQVLGYAGIQGSENLYDWQPLKLEALLNRILKEYRPVFESEGWRLKVDLTEELPSIKGDLKALESCFRNLFDNALKYGSDGKWLEIELKSTSESGKSGVEVLIKDRGKGVSRSEISSIFDPFFRGSGQVASAIPGTGLGLALVKRHIEAHGGEILASSKPGLGTEFKIYLPASDPKLR